MTTIPSPTRPLRTAAAPTLIVGCGNLEAGDDAIGLDLLTRITKQMPPACSFTELPGDVLSLVDSLDPWEHIIFLDAVRSGTSPGTIHIASLPSKAIDSNRLASTSTHGWGIDEAVELMRKLARKLPRLGLIGVEIVHTVYGAPMSAETCVARDFVVGNFDALRACVAWMEPGDPPLHLSPPKYSIPEEWRA